MVDIIKLDMTDIWASSGDKTAPDPSKIATGWIVEAVPRQWWNWFENRQDVNIAYMLQKGIPEWDQFTEYLTNKSYVQRNNIVYKAILTSTNQDPATQPTYWVKAFPESSASLEAIRVLTPAADRIAYYTNGTTAALTTLTSFARTLLDDTTNTAARTTLGAQASHANLTALSGATAATNTFPYWNSSTTMLASAITAFGRALLDDADAATARATLELGSVSTYDVTTTALDNTTDRITKVGDFGENGGVPIGLGNTTDVDTLTVAATYVFANGGINLPTASAFYLKHVSYPIAGYGKQFAWNISQNLEYSRVQQAGVWSAWDQNASHVDVYAKLAEFGIGSVAVPLAANLNSITTTSVQRFTGSSTNIPVASAVGTVFTMSYDSLYKTQLAIMVDVGSGGNRIFNRTLNNSVWGPWQEGVNVNFMNTTLAAYALNGANTDITSLTGVNLISQIGLSGSINANFSDATTVPTSYGSLVSPKIRLTDNAGGPGSVLALQGYSTTTTDAGSTLVGTRSNGIVGVHASVPTNRSVFTLLGAASDGTKYNPIARIDYYTVNGQTGSNAGGEIRFLTTPINTLVPTLSMTLTNGGNLNVVGSITASSLALTNALGVAQGGTGVTTSTGSGSVVLSASPTLTGLPLAPTAAPGTNTTQLATTAFVAALGALKANLASPTFTGTPLSTTAAPGTNTTQIATTAFVTTADNLKANLASPSFTGTPLAPTAAGGTNNTQIATTAFVTTQINSLGLTPQSSLTDPTPGRLLSVGSFGLGASSANIPSVANVTTTTIVGFYKFAGGTTGAPPQFAGAGGSLIVHSLGGNFIQQIAISIPTIVDDPYMCIRHYDTNGNPGAWTRFVTNKSMVGTVAFAGVPTGAVMEHGTNASGEYTKYADGRLICVAKYTGAPIAVTPNTPQIIGPFSTPAAFIDGTHSVVACAVPTLSNDHFGVTSSYAVTASSVEFVYRNGGTAQSITNIRILCVGRWY